MANIGSSAKFCVLVFKASLLWYWGVHWPKKVCLPSFVYWYSRHLCSGTIGGSISQSRFICQVLCTGIQGICALLPGGFIGQCRFICQVLCTGIQGISALLPGGPLAKVGSSAKFCVLVFKASVLWYHWGEGSISQSRFVCQVLCTGIEGISALLPGGPLAKEGSSAKFCVLVFKASLLWYHWGGPLAKEGLSSKFCVLVFKASLLWYLGRSIGQHSFICQVLCTGIQGICALLPGGPLAKVGSSAKFCVLVFKASLLWYHWGEGSISQSRFVCQVLCTGIEGISALLPGGPLAKEGSSAKFCVLVFKASVLWYQWGEGSISQSRFVFQVLCTGIQGISALLPRGSTSQSRFICQVLCTGIQGISALLPRGAISQSRFICQVVCTGIPGISALLPRGVHWPK